MAKAIMVQGTASNAGKSMLTTALCRIFKQDGYNVAPFKSQNMSLNSFVTIEGEEVSRAQAAQAEAAQVELDVRMNPILLKPTGNSTSQVIVKGSAVGTMSSVEYFAYRKNLMPVVQECYASLASEYDIVVIEGAGSPAEINLRSEYDYVNMGMAKIANAPVLLAGDIDKGGVFASLYGTVKLLEADEQEYIKGLIINKFRGDATLLTESLPSLAERIGKPFMGIVPYVNAYLDAEDSLSDNIDSINRISGGQYIDIAILRLPHLSNATDFAPLKHINNAFVRYVNSSNSYGEPDLVIIPGTKNTIKDLAWLKSNGLDKKIAESIKNNKLVMGICGGYQMLQNGLSDPHGIEEGGDAEALGMLNAETTFGKVKKTRQLSGKFEGLTGVYAELNGAEFQGYEVHAGTTVLHGDAIAMFNYRDDESKPDGMQNGNVLGTYAHGLFDSSDIISRMQTILYKSKGLSVDVDNMFSIAKFKDEQYNILADTVRQALDMDEVYRILNKGVK